MPHFENRNTKLEKTLKNITFSSSLENIPLVEKYVDDLYEEFRFSQEIYGNILIATLEAVNNAIIHGNKKDPNKEVIIEVELKDSDCLVMRVSDEGKGFDFDNLPDPVAPENIEKPYGRGIFLIKHLADKCIFHNNGKTVEIHFNLAK